jgi:two-component system, NarL family, response regulator NreC
MKKTRILIADDHDVVRSGLKMLLRSHEGFSVVAEAADGEEAIQMVERHKPDVAILDISMPKLDGIEATRAIKQRYPDTRILILSVHQNEEYAYQVLKAGASGYLLKNAGKKEIVAAIRAVLSGKQSFSPGISQIIVDGFVNRTKDPAPRDAVKPSNSLTERETEVLRLIAEGLTSRQIAEKLFLSFRTVNTHRANLMAKLDIHDTAGLVRYAINTGLVTLKS